jgi:Bifunctional DNA primase/polymerase, N-terminal
MDQTYKPPGRAAPGAGRSLLAGNDHPTKTIALEKQALHWCNRGVPVFPQRRGSRAPLTPHGFKDASCDPKVVTDFFERHPFADIGGATGNGILVVDVDGDDGEASLLSWVNTHGDLPRTLTQKTRRGFHLFFSTPVDVPSQTGKSAPVPGLDIICRGHAITLAPSTHPSGIVYRIVRDLPIAPVPGWLLKLATPKPKPPRLKFFASRNIGPEIDPKAVAAVMGGDLRKGEALIPGPGHSRADRSLSVRPAPNSDGFVVWSFAGDDPLECKDYVRRAMGMPEWRPGGGI